MIFPDLKSLPFVLALFYLGVPFALGAMWQAVLWGNGRRENMRDGYWTSTKHMVVAYLALLVAVGLGQEVAKLF